LRANKQENGVLIVATAVATTAATTTAAKQEQAGCMQTVIAACMLPHVP